MCVYSWVNATSSQSVVFPISSSPVGATAVSSIASYGNGFAQPFEMSVWSTRITCTRPRGTPSVGSKRARTRSTIAARRRAMASSP